MSTRVRNRVLAGYARAPGHQRGKQAKALADPSMVISHEAVRDLFSHFGQVLHGGWYHHTKNRRTFCFVDFESEDDARNTIMCLITGHFVGYGRRLRMLIVEAKGPLPLGLQDWADTLSIGWANQRVIKSAADTGKANEPSSEAQQPSEPPAATAEAESSSAAAGVKREEKEEDRSSAPTGDATTEAQIPPKDTNLVGFTPVNRDSRPSVKLIDPAESDTEDEEQDVASLATTAIHKGSNVQTLDDEEPAVISERRLV